ncbi:hypothetical protein HGO75_07180 [Mycobacterium tuberculosis]|nr:hypothetical protein [Mycobacterium tuberculosis]
MSGIASAALILSLALVVLPGSPRCRLTPDDTGRRVLLVGARRVAWGVGCVAVGVAALLPLPTVVAVAVLGATLGLRYRRRRRYLRRSREGQALEAALELVVGELRAYVRGFGVEVMANSDNVLRGGLTPKHVDVPELLRVLDFAPTPKARLRPPIRREGLGLVFETPTDEFAATLLVLDGDHLGHEVDASSGHDGPQILLCTEGSATVHGKCGSLTLQRGTPPGWRPTTARSG